MTKQEKGAIVHHIETVAMKIASAQASNDQKLVDAYTATFDSLMELSKELFLPSDRRARSRYLERGAELAKMEVQKEETNPADAPSEPIAIDYDRQKQSFLQAARVHLLNKAGIAIYLCLLDFWKKRKWSEWILVSNWQIRRAKDVPEGIIHSAKRRLEHLGMVKIAPPSYDGEHRGTGYKLCRLYAC